MTASRTVEIGDTVVQVAGEGTPLVFVHGFTTTAEFWREQVGRSRHVTRWSASICLAMAGHRVPRDANTRSMPSSKTS